MAITDTAQALQSDPTTLRATQILRRLLDVPSDIMDTAPCSVQPKQCGMPREWVKITISRHTDRLVQHLPSYKSMVKLEALD